MSQASPEVGLGVPRRVVIRAAGRLVRGRWRSATLVALLGALLAVPLVGLAVVRDTSLRAAIDGIDGRRGGSDMLVVATGPDALPAMSAVPGAIAVAYRPAIVSGGTARRVGVGAWTLSAPDRPLYRLDAGTRPAGPGEATVSARVRDRLGLALGAAVSITDPQGGQATVVRVVGVTSNPASADESHVQLVDPHLAAAAATSWLVPASAAAALPQGPTVSVGSESAEVAALLDHPPAATRATGRLLRLLAAPLLLGVLAALVPLAGRTRGDVAALVAAGLAPRRAWTVVQLAAGGLLAAGALGGAAGVLVFAARFGRAASHLIGQDWSTIVAPWPLIGGLVATLAPVGVSAPPLLRAVARRVAARASSPSGTGSGTAPGVASAQIRVRGPALAVGAGGALLLAAWVATDPTGEPLGRLLTAAGGFLAAVAGVVFLGSALAGLGSPRAVGALTRHLARGVRGLLAAALLIAAGGALSAAVDTSNANALAARHVGEAQPRGSLLVAGLPQVAIASVQAWHGGPVRAFLDVDPGPAPLIAAAGACAETLTACAQGGLPTGTIALDPHLLAGEARARPALLRDGVVTVLRQQGEADRATTVATVAAQPDPGLGEATPALLVSPESPLVARFGLAPTGFATVVVDDVPADQAPALRARLADLAPTAQVSRDIQEVATDQVTGIARGVAFGAATIAGLLSALGVAALLLGHRRLRSDLGALGASTPDRLALAARALAGGLAACVVLAAGVGAAAGVITAGLTGRIDASAWLPPLSVLVVLLAGALRFARP